MNKKIMQVTAIGMSQVKLLSALNSTLMEEGYEVHSLCTADEYEDEIRQSGVVFHNVNVARSINITSNIKTLLSMIKVFKTVKPDILHVHTPVAALLGRIAGRLSGVPHIIYTAHGFYFHEGMSRYQYYFYYLLEKYAARFCTDYIFTQSREDCELAVKGGFLREENCLHISNGIDLDARFNYNSVSQSAINSLKKELGIGKETVVFSFLGRMVKEKGILDLLEAFSSVNEIYPDTVLICMGSMPDSERDQTAGKEIEKYHDKQSIIFTGQLKSPELYYAASDVFVLPSYREGMPRSIIEAMAMFNAVIATNIRGAREEVTHGENGLLVPVGDTAELARAMSYLLDRPELIEQMKEAGYARTLEEYDEKKVVKKQLEVFGQLVEEDGYETVI
ncbi:glycosyltransferase family 1 protein [Jeotgalicoccus nanhaiensis]|uniref:Glycosyltransferase family 4 protein n=1 Tax=Jeotgalicoccus nanhaiensis TaxID=568603 RepID=A0ABR9XXC1_9STAP|nr:glycosyltransferase family 4 protein [Jeotgalicoccus nanhaiensis]MBF0753114.1 glycosyltransferase family 4 protein [Jeotgalicoccus nanhaiensis]TFU62287.1 glycosyltransferase family 1 protein [Jeotgalicoccus nanhaiensis]